jgi:hypothetical protein
MPKNPLAESLPRNQRASLETLKARRAEIMKELGRIDWGLDELARHPLNDTVEVLEDMNAREAAAREAAARRVRHRVVGYTNENPNEFIIGGVVYVRKESK